jgi:microcystin-dependent protein
METFIGTIMMFGGNFAPRDWAFCQGQTLSIASNTSLFSILGTTYGGDGRTTFNLPKLESPIPGAHYIICLNGIYPPRS